VKEIAVDAGADLMTVHPTEKPPHGGPILETKDLNRYFGQMAALSMVNLSIREKEITSLIGPNGAGKTTFYNTITGRFPPSSGKVFFKGKDVTGLPPHKIVKLGMGRSFQITSIFKGLTVLENVRAAVIARSPARMNLFTPVESSRSLYDQSMHYVELVGLEDKKDQLCSILSHGDMRTVEIAITLASNPDLVLLDEPTQGMTPEETKRMVNLIRDLAERTKTTFFVIEHDMNVVFSISDRIVVLYYGSILADGTPDEIRSNRKVKEAYLGGLTDADA
jgi:branched-chain amino acid transport system ATP-binding protein